MADMQTPAIGGGRCGSFDPDKISPQDTPQASHPQVTRRRLPNRRASEIAVFEHEGRRYRASVSRFSDGALGEIFIDAAKFGSDIALHANEAAILASLALQFGATANELRHTIRGPLGVAIGIFGEAKR